MRRRLLRAAALAAAGAAVFALVEAALVRGAAAPTPCPSSLHRTRPDHGVPAPGAVASARPGR